MKIKTFIQSAAKYAVLCLPVMGCKQENTKPNIIIFLTDDLGYNDVSCYRNENFSAHVDGFPTSQTPNIDRLARQGMRFTDFYGGAPVSSPSRAALMTGRNATRVGIYNYIPPDTSLMHLKNGEITLAELLKEKHYATGHFGKWHLSSQGRNHPLPNDQGFDYSFFTYNNANPSHHNPENYFRNGNAVGKTEGYACNIVVNEAIRWLDKNKNEPFFLNVWFNEPHVKVAAPESLTRRHTYNKEYYGAIENMDIAVGKLLTYLEQQHLVDNTIIIFASDNGSQWDYSNQPFRGEKCFTYEGGVRVPFVIKWENHVPENVVSAFNGSFTDIFPSIASIVGVPLPSDRTIDGMDISPVFLGKRQTMVREEPVFFYRYFHDPVCMLRKDDWCLLGYDSIMPIANSLDESVLAKIKPWYFTKGHMDYLKTITPRYYELYNLKNDREQQLDVAEQHHELVENMKSKMLSLLEEMILEGDDWYEMNE